MREDVVAPTDAAQLEAKSLDEAAQIAKGDVGQRSARDTREKPPLIHSEHRNLRLGWDTRVEFASDRSARRHRIEIIE
jgi:hypothetical protein